MLFINLICILFNQATLDEIQKVLIVLYSANYHNINKSINIYLLLFSLLFTIIIIIIIIIYYYYCTIVS